MPTPGNASKVMDKFFVDLAVKDALVVEKVHVYNGGTFIKEYNVNWRNVDGVNVLHLDAPLNFNRGTAILLLATCVTGEPVAGRLIVRGVGGNFRNR